MKPAKGKTPSQLKGHQYGKGGVKMTPKAKATVSKMAKGK